MNKFILLFIFYFIYFITFSQKTKSEKVSVEKSILSIQTGYFGTWINHELKLHNQFALRTEVGTEYRLKFAIKQSFDSLKNQVSVFLEDPVTWSAHCTLTPYWSNEILKKRMNAQQISERKGKLSCELKKDRVEISGKAITYFEGYISL